MLGNDLGRDLAHGAALAAAGPRVTPLRKGHLFGYRSGRLGDFACLIVKRAVSLCFKGMVMTFVFAAVALAAMGQTAPPGTFQMTSADVQTCGALAVDRNNRKVELDRRDAELSTERSALEARRAEVEAQRATVKANKKKDVAKFNALIESTNAAATAFQPKVTARNAYLAETQTVVDSFNAKCTHRSLNPADLAALPAEQQAAFGQINTKTIMVPGQKKATKR